MEFNWQGHCYKLYGVEVPLSRKVNHHQGKKQIKHVKSYVIGGKSSMHPRIMKGSPSTNKSKDFKIWFTSYKLNLANAQIKNHVKPLKPDKLKNDAAKITLTREIPIYYPLRTKKSKEVGNVTNINENVVIIISIIRIQLG